MRQVVCDGAGDVSVLRLQTDAPMPQPQPGELRVRVHAAGVNRPDLLQRKGLYPPPADASPHLGLEISGVVDACGDGVHGFKSGDAVCALVAGGGYAEYVCVPEGMLMQVPKGLSLTQAAALPETCMTVWANVFERCALAPGEVFLVHAGASSIGLTAIAMAHAHGSIVLATTGSGEKAQACIAAGAHAVFRYDTASWAGDMSMWLKQQRHAGIDVLLDMIGGTMLAESLPLMAVEGRVASIAQLGGPIVEVDLMRLMLKRLTLTGSTLRARSLQYKMHLADVLQQRVWPWIEQGQYRPVVHAMLPVEQVAHAHAMLERRENIGKVLLCF